MGRRDADAVPSTSTTGSSSSALPCRAPSSGTVKAIMPAKRRTGVGVTSAQRHQTQMVIRVVSSDGSTVRGTALAAHEPGSLDSAFLQSTYQTMKFPAGYACGRDDGAALTPVANRTATASSSRSAPIPSSTAAARARRSTSTGRRASPTIPERVQFPSPMGVAWLDICTGSTPGTPGDEPEDVGDTPAPGDDESIRPSTTSTVTGSSHTTARRTTRRARFDTTTTSRA